MQELITFERKSRRMKYAEKMQEYQPGKAYENIIEQIKFAMELKGITQQMIEDITGIKRTQISIILTYKNRPRLDTLLTILDAVGLELFIKLKQDD